MVSGSPWENPEGKVIGSTQAVVPVIRLYGVTSEGASVMVSVHGFTPYFYVSLPINTDLNDSFLSTLRGALDNRVSKSKFFLIFYSLLFFLTYF